MRARRSWPLSLAVRSVAASGAAAREAVDASAPADARGHALPRSQPRRRPDAMNRDWPRGFAMITETRTVTLPPGESTIRFDGVAEGMVAVSAIVTGLPGGTIEKNRNADLLSPARAGRRHARQPRHDHPHQSRDRRARSREERDRPHPRRRRAGAADRGGLRGGALLGPAREADLRPRARRAVGAAGVQHRHARSGGRHLHGRADLSRLGLRLAGALRRHARRGAARGDDVSSCG